MKLGKKKKKSKFLVGTYVFLLILLMNFVSADDYDCEENWSCTDYGLCDGDYQYRTCKELNGCDYIEHKPITVVGCGLYLSESETCGNGVVDATETYLNCNSDIKLTPGDYFKCLKAGERQCLYYKDYLANGVFYGIIGFLVLYYFFGEKK